MGFIEYSVIFAFLLLGFAIGLLINKKGYNEEEKCPQSEKGEHNWYYEDYAFTYQEKVCKNCGRRFIVDK